MLRLIHWLVRESQLSLVAAKFSGQLVPLNFDKLKINSQNYYQLELQINCNVRL
jgi:hypothetical protein